MSEENTAGEMLEAEETATAVEEEVVETTEQAEEAEVQEANSEEEETKKKPWFKERFDELTKKRYEAEAEKERVKAELEAYKKKYESAEKPTDNKKPTKEDFDYDDDKYIEALADWKVEQAIAKRTANEREHQQLLETERAQADLQVHIANTVNAGREKYEDYDEVLSRVSGDVLNLEMARIIQKSVERPEDVTYYLGANQEEAQKIASMPPEKKIAALAKIEAKLDLQPPRKKVSSAPPPIKPVGQKATAGVDLSKMSSDEYRAYRDKQERARMEARFQ